MGGRVLRGVIVGASSLLGEELAEELDENSPSAWNLTLVDAAEPESSEAAVSGRETGVSREQAAASARGAAGHSQGAAADEEGPAPQPLTAEAFHGADIVFFAADKATARDYWKAAHDAGASIVDLTGALQGSPGVLLRCPWTHAGAAPDLATVAVSLAHPAALMLGTAAERLKRFGLARMAATVLEPASQQGRAGVDEMHQQTVALLSFKPLVQDVFDAQAAFNLRVALGSGAGADLGVIGARIAREAAELAGADAAVIAVQAVQAPVFHGSTASVFVELKSSVEESAVRAALHGEGMRVSAGYDAVTNESVSGDGEIALTLRPAGSVKGETKVQSGGTDGAKASAYWLWMAADNLLLTARSAASCAVELAALRPAAGVN